MRRLIVILGLLALAGGVVACRELSAPVQQLQGEATFRANIQRPDGGFASEAQVVVTPLSPQLQGRYRGVATTNGIGSFLLETPDVPLRVLVVPAQGHGVEPHEFVVMDPERDDGHYLVMPGIAVSVDFEFGASTPWDCQYSLRLDEVDAEGRLIEGAPYSFRGWRGSPSFRAALPHAGRYRLTLEGDRDPDLYYVWSEAIEIADGDSLWLEIPTVPIELYLTIGGEPLAPNRWLTKSSLRSDHGSVIHVQETRYLDYAFRPDFRYGPQLGDALAGATRIVVSEASDWAPFIPIVMDVPPLQGGESFEFEVGLYECLVRVRDSDGHPVDRARVIVTREGAERRAQAMTDVDGDEMFYLNPGWHTIHVQKLGYEDVAIPYLVEHHSSHWVELHTIGQ